ncbi:cohesin subunit SA-2 isoform X2 [Hydra vulgaris]|uniref:cohesin subunit SA-2 isoform X2 n=1 Tax=Hydra vulgaris TaxID=6087 RepID=UPI000640DCA2|nr:cohesin subunit SA-2 isoform X2 [Hydra vulgaris]
MPGLTSNESFSQNSNISSPSLDLNSFDDNNSTLVHSDNINDESDDINTSFTSQNSHSQDSLGQRLQTSPSFTSPITVSSQHEVSSELIENTSTVYRNKKVNDRRISNRITAKPNFFDASPIAATNMTKSSNNKSQSTTVKVVDSDDEDKIDDSESFVKNEDKFKKPTLPPKKKSTKTPLDVKVKKSMNNKVKSSVLSDESSLFDIVKGGKSALASVIDDWIDNYNHNKSDAMVELLQFIVNCTGCNAQVKRSMIEEDSVMVIRHLTENFGEQAEEYPLIINRPEFKKFKGHFALFITQLVNMCQHGIIYDDEMIVVLVNWIVTLSSSPVRAFRHTSTFAGLKLMTALIDVALKVGVEIDNNKRQLDNENQTAIAKRSREKVEKLKKKSEELKQNQERLEDLMNHILNSIFVARYRDIRPEIRLLCFSEMGIWMIKYSHYFLKENLKYLGWTLYDKVSEVRLEVLKVLHELYKNEHLVEQLVLFTGRFKSRIIDMTLDMDTDVAVEAIKIVSILYKYGVLDTEECSLVEQLVFCDQRKIAHAAGDFLALHIDQLSSEATPTKMKKGQKEEYLCQMKIRAIIDFFLKTEVHDHCAYIVDSLWEHANLVKDWKTMTSMLLDPNPLIELEDEEERVLIDIMCSACKQAAEGLPPPGRTLNRKLSQKEKDTINDDRNAISSHFMEYLPKFLEKYKADVVKTNELLTIPQYFRLDVYAEKRLTKHLDALLSHMEDIVLKNTDSNLLLTCAQTYYYLIDTDLGVRQNAEISKNKTLDCVVEKLRKSIAFGIPNDGEDKKSQSYFNVVTNLKKIDAFNRFHDLSDWDLYEDINAIIDQGINGSVDEEVLLLSISITNMTLLMSFTSIDADNPDKGVMKILRKRQKHFVKQSDELLQFGGAKIKTQIFNILCDFFIMFSKQILNKAPLLAPIVYEADSNLQVQMRDFVITHVFNTISEEVLQDEEDDLKAQELHSKRLLLAGFCKLLSFNVFDIKLAAPIFGQFLRGYADYSDIIKQLMTYARENNIILFSKVLLFSLQQAFESLREDHNGKIDVKSEEFHSIKDLAHRFALMLGVNTHLDNPRKSTITIHREGITYAFNNSDNVSVPTNILFLEVLHEFTYRLTKIDRKAVLNHLKEVGGNMLTKKGPEWMPIQTYQNGLTSSADESKVIKDDADQELEDAINLEKKTKSIVETAKKAPAPRNDKKVPVPRNDKARKKLSMSKASESGRWLNASKIKTDRKITSVNKSKTKSPKNKNISLAPNSHSGDDASVDFQIEKSSKKKTTKVAKSITKGGKLNVTNSPSLPLMQKSLIDGNNDTDQIEKTPKKKTLPKVAKSIPKAIKLSVKSSPDSPHIQKSIIDKNDSVCQLEESYEESVSKVRDIQSSKKRTKPISNAKKIIKSKEKNKLENQESDQSSSEHSPEKPIKNQNQKAKNDQLLSAVNNEPAETLSVEKNRKFAGKKRGSVASSPLRLSMKSPAKKIKLQSNESSVVDDGESSQENKSSAEDSFTSEAGDSHKKKFARKSYEMRSTAPLKRITNEEISSSGVTSSTGSSSTNSPLSNRLTKKQKRDLSPDALNESQDLLESSP